MNRIFSVIVVAMLFAACAGSAADTIDARALEVVNENDLRAHVAWLAADERRGRMTGEPGYDAAARYVAEAFDAFGLEPGGDGGWFQKVPLVS